MSLLFVRIATVFLQTMSGLLALTLIRLTKRKNVWVWISSAILLTAAERAFTYYQLLQNDRLDRLELASEHIALYIAFLMLMGIGGLHTLFRQMAESNHKVRKSEEKYRTLLENLPQCIYLKDADMSFTSCNDNFARDVNVSASEISGKTDFDLFEPALAQSNYESDLKALQRDDVEESETISERNGNRIYHRCVKTPVRDEAGVKTGLLVVYWDVTAQKKAQIEHEELQKKMLQAQKLESLGVLAGGIAHDFNNLLTGVLGNVYLLLNDLDEESESYESVAAIQSAANRAADLTNQMLAYSGQGQYMVMPLDVASEIDKFDDFLRSSISKKAYLDFEIAEDMPRLHADPSQLRQVLLNLVANASEALGDAAGVIKIVAGTREFNLQELRRSVVNTDELSAGNYIYIRVEDTGCGFEQQNAGRLFEPFYTTKFTGRGLGLSAVLGIVRAQGGGILVKSERDSGSSFEVVLPKTSATVEDVDTKEAGPSDDYCMLQGSGTVLVVDDERVVREVAKRLIEMAGFKVLIATNGREATEMFRSDHKSIACVLLDMTMPVMNGREVLEELCKIDPAVKIIVSSGYSESEIMPLFKDMKTVAFVPKPYNFKKLYDAIGAATR